MAVTPREVATHRTTRADVYAAINTEREYQDSFVLPENEYWQTHTLGEFILMLNQYSAQAQDKWTHPTDPDAQGFEISLHEVRKIAALAVRCMEQHGAPPRILPAKAATA